MHRFPLPDLNTLPEDLRTKILEVQEKSGFVPNVFLALARRPAEWRAFFAYHDALMLREESSLTKGEREMIITTTSAANHCLYCVVAHGAILRIYEKKPLVADQVAINYRKADITPRQRAICVDMIAAIVTVARPSLPTAPSPLVSICHFDAAMSLSSGRGMRAISAFRPSSSAMSSTVSGRTLARALFPNERPDAPVSGPCSCERPEFRRPSSFAVGRLIPLPPLEARAMGDPPQR